MYSLVSSQEPRILKVPETCKLTPTPPKKRKFLSITATTGKNKNIHLFDPSYLFEIYPTQNAVYLVKEIKIMFPFIYNVCILLSDTHVNFCLIIPFS